MITLRQKLLLAWIKIKTKDRSNPDLIDNLGFPYWIWYEEEDAFGNIERKYTNGVNSQAIKFKLSNGGDYLNLAGIEISPNLWNRGIGSQLMDFIKAHTLQHNKRGIKGYISSLDVIGHIDRPPNPHLPQWYRNHGFWVEDVDFAKDENADIRLDF